MLKVFVPHEVLALPPAQTFGHIRALLKQAAPGDDTWYARWWAADALTLMGRYADAVAMYPPASFGRAVLQVERLLSLKLVARIPYTADDALALLGPRITAYGRKHLAEVRRATKFLVAESEATDLVGSLRAWADQSPARPYTVYIGSSAGYAASNSLDLTHYEFSKSPDLVDYCRSLARKAENMVREDAGVPHVGEGWLSETQLFYELRSAFPEFTVEQHASPHWLGRQHLDVYIPELAVGVEFQGLQHDQPVDFFGGSEAFEAVRKRDARKRRLCARNGVRLVYVREGYNLAEVIAQIQSKSGT